MLFLYKIFKIKIANFRYAFSCDSGFTFDIFHLIFIQGEGRRLKGEGVNVWVKLR